MNKTLSLLASTLIVGLGSSLTSTPVGAREVDCINYWVNPETRLVQCFDSELNSSTVPFIYLSDTANNTNSEQLLRRRATDSVEMIMPDLVGLEIDAAEDYLLNLGVTLGSKEVYAYDKAAGEIVQQSPLPGTELAKGQTVLLQYMGATVNPIQVK